ncbi:MAG TPA: AAA family ATPase [Marmoricola sp.]|nr:AAA family ATPase [Marmoricola sp.]
MSAAITTTAPETAMMGDVSLPSTLHGRTLVGRDAELAELCELLGVRGGDDAARGTARAVLLGGDAGVGKTRLLTELRDVATAEGWRVVAGHCLDFGDSALPYLPFSEVLGRLATDLPAVVDEVAASYPTLAKLQPGRRTMGADVDDTAAVGRAELLDAVHALLEAVAGDRPLLLVIEDAHWADTSTRDMVRFLLSRLFEGPVVTVVSYRSDDLHRRHPLRRAVAEWARVPGVERIQLEPLRPVDVRRLVHELHPGPMRESDVAGIIARAEGNAFFVEELVGAAIAPGQALPDSLAELLLVRLDRLEEDAQQVVRAASVSGRRVSHALLTHVAGLSAGALDQALREAVELNVLVPTRDDSYAFRHALLAEAVYDDLLPGERVRLHKAYVAALLAPDTVGTSAELARHALLARDVGTAIEASVRAGDEAMAVGGPDDAAHHYLTALELVTDPGAPANLDVDLGLLGSKSARALIASGRPARALSLLQEQLTDLPADAQAEWRARLLAEVAQTIPLTENNLDPLVFTEEAMRLVPDTPSPMRARVLAAHARAHAFRRHRDEARAVGAEALAMAESQDLPRLATDVLTTLASLGSTGSDEVREALEEATKQASATGATGAELRSLYFLGNWYHDRAQFDEAADAYARAAARGEELGQPWAPYAFDSRFMQGLVSIGAGRLDEAVRLADVTGQAPPAVCESLLAALDLVVHGIRGRTQALKLVPELRPHWPREGLLPITAGPAAIELHGQLGQADKVVDEHDAIVAEASRLWRKFFHARVRVAAVTQGALASLVADRPSAERAQIVATGARIHDGGLRTLEAHLEEEAGRWGLEGQAWGARLLAEQLRLRWLAGVDVPSEAELVDAWRAALVRFEAYGHVFELARTQARLAAVLHAAGETAEARELVVPARAAALRLGAQPLLAELHAIDGGSATGQRRPTARRQPGPAAIGPAALTAREREILALVAAGRTNGEIGKQLFIATKTASVHVSNILAKLGASSRTEAAAIARRDGLLG